MSRMFSLANDVFMLVLHSALSGETFHREVGDNHKKGIIKDSEKHNRLKKS